ncbi:MAG: hypothetical protein XD87_0214 [candidate division WS6 bacterium 36_33]|uniref:Tail specific protease domain-containing protein n=1 Tax=candidate division WS6 bacterium 36_33 TaxID=1641388 RepID=A0A101GZJ1_9BACT|nr:MAG: hypothetical protein XD87_0214 [candidate division WS6 bacterium 36_33]
MKIFNKKQLSVDLDYFSTQLIKMHPNPFKYIKKGEFLSYLEELKTSSEEVGLEEVGIRLMKLLARLKDGHTELGASDNVLGTLNYPFKFKYVNNEYYVVSASEEYKQYLGFELLNINDKSISEIENLLRVIIPIENETSLRYYLPTKLVEPKLLNYFGIVNGNDVKFVFQKGKEKITVEVTALDYNTELIDINGTIKELDVTLDRKDVYWIKDMPELEAVYVQYNECKEREDYKMSQVVKDIKNFNRKKLVIDLRNNKGGDSDVLNPLLNYIRKNQNKIKIFVLIGVDTYSSAIYNLVQLSRFKNVLTIGDIPHGNPTHYGQVKSFVLPNSKLRIFTSTRIFTFKGYTLGESFKPNYAVPQIPEELFVGKDTQFRYLKENLL